ncbi:MAG: V-type ATPase subunit [Treponema sp.]|nr:V-type ATPase subunit [Treponema sp.]
MREDSGYAYAKAGWIVGRSFLEKRFSTLYGIHTLNEFDRLIFPETHRELPGRELLPCLERRITERAVRRIFSVLNSYTEIPKLLVRMFRSFEYADLKECLVHITGANKDKPVICDIGRFKTINFNAYPDITAMLKKTEFEDLLSSDLKQIKQGMDLTAIESKLDFSFYSGLIECLAQLSDEDRDIASRLLADEISLRNCLWALRLRTYYGKSEIETSRYLMNLRLPGSINMKRTFLASDALASLDFSLDVRKDWRSWRWERFLNPADTAVSWKADPRYFQNAASRYLYHLAYHNFHSSPMSVSAIYCFIKLVQFEEDLLTSVAEGLSLGMDSSGIFRLLEAG